MTKKSMQLFIAAAVLTASFFSFQSFTKAPKDITNGGGIAGGTNHFNYTAVENKSGVTGHFTWNGTDYDVICIYKSGNAATIYLSEGMAVNVVDDKSGDTITEPFLAIQDCGLAAVAPEAALSVTEGNLTVHK